MNLKEDIHAQNVQLKIANKDLRVKLNKAISENSAKIAFLIISLAASIFFNLFAYYLLTR